MNLYNVEYVLDFIRENITAGSMKEAIKVFEVKYNTEPDSIKLIAHNISKDEVRD